MRVGDLLEELIEALAASHRAVPEEDMLTLLNHHNVVNISHPKLSVSSYVCKSPNSADCWRLTRERIATDSLKNSQVNPFWIWQLSGSELILICIALNNLKLGEAVTICIVISGESICNWCGNGSTTHLNKLGHGELLNVSTEGILKGMCRKVYVREHRCQLISQTDYFHPNTPDKLHPINTLYILYIIGNSIPSQMIPSAFSSEDESLKMHSELLCVQVCICHYCCTFTIVPLSIVLSCI